MKTDSHSRSITKAVSYRILGTLATFFTAWFVTGSTDLALSLTAVDFFGKIALYWLHERIWLKL